MLLLGDEKPFKRSDGYLALQSQSKTRIDRGRKAYLTFEIPDTVLVQCPYIVHKYLNIFSKQAKMWPLRLQMLEVGLEILYL